MRSKAMSLLTLALFMIGLLVVQGNAIIANPLISRGKPTVGSPAGGTANLVNGRFRDPAWNVAANTWVAINLGAGPSKVFLTWNNSNYTWSSQMIATPNCPQTLTWPINYEVLTSGNSTNGTDGQWTTAVTVTNNIVTARGHLIDFTGMSWVKIHFTSGGGPIDEIEAFDASNGSEDTWFFAGTSISANTYKNALPVGGKNFADLIVAAHPGYNPSMIRGGIPCINSTDMATHISQYIAIMGNVHYCGIEMGTNDGWNNGTTYLPTFKANMQTIITALKAKGIQPIIARTISTNPDSAKWQIDPAYPKTVDTLTTSNNLIAGPDLYTYFLAHPQYLAAGGGVHPNDSGCAAIQKMWADKMSSLYPVTSIIPRGEMQPTLKNRINIATVGNRVDFQSQTAGTISIFTAKGALLNKINASRETTGWTAPSRGIYLVQFASCVGPQTAKVLIR